MQTHNNLPPGAVDASGGVFFLTLDKNDRLLIETTIENLINMLDDMEPDPDLEPSIGGWCGGGTAHDEREADFVTACGVDGFADDEPMLGAPELHPASFDSPWGRSGVLTHHDRSKSQERWASGNNHPGGDDCEDVSEDEGATTGDDEFSLGWSEEGSLVGNLSAGSYGMEGELEPEIGWTEEVDQVRRLDRAEGWMVEDSETDLGWAESHGRGVWSGGQNCVDDRERDDCDREPELDGGEEECCGESPAPIPGGAEHDQVAPKPGKYGTGLRVPQAPPKLPEWWWTRSLMAEDFNRLPWA